MVPTVIGCKEWDKAACRRSSGSGLTGRVHGQESIGTDLLCAHWPQMRTIASSPPTIMIELTYNAQFLSARPVFSLNFTTTLRDWFSELLTFTDQEAKTEREV